VTGRAAGAWSPKQEIRWWPGRGPDYRRIHWPASAVTRKSPSSPWCQLCQAERTERPLRWMDLAEGRL